ncbi:guanine nucleotide-binding protein subunit alpha [Lobulomyces angularis]|nr:guanine nucleotide-binding protein subunit alpha [Lobulomyces angularis]
MEEIEVNVTNLEDDNGINLQVELPQYPKKAKKRTKEIEKQLKKEKKLMSLNNACKVLILGTGDSGKSTVVRQIRLCNSVLFTGEEKEYFKKIIWENVYVSLKDLLRCAEMLGFTEKSQEYQENALFMKTFIFDKKKKSFDPNVVRVMTSLWEDHDIKETFKRKSELKNMHIQDTAINFFNELDRILDVNYIPTDQDIVLCRRQTCNITETVLAVPKLGTIKFYDVGGQKHLRNFWVPYFEDSHAILFIAALSCFDQNMAEEEGTNRMVDCISLFNIIVNNPSLQNITIVLFLNKVDLFKEKLKLTNVSDYFEDFKAPQSEKSAANFFIEKFKGTTTRQLKYIHLTTGTDSKLMKKIIGTVLTIITKLSLKASGLVEDSI